MSVLTAGERHALEFYVRICDNMDAINVSTLSSRCTVAGRDRFLTSVALETRLRNLSEYCEKASKRLGEKIVKIQEYHRGIFGMPEDEYAIRTAEGAIPRLMRKSAEFYDDAMRVAIADSKG